MMVSRSVTRRATMIADALATLRLGSVLHLAFFDVAGCVLVMLLALMWLIVGTRTVQGAYRGELFVSPCIAGLKK